MDLGVAASEKKTTPVTQKANCCCDGIANTRAPNANRRRRDTILLDTNGPLEKDAHAYDQTLPIVILCFLSILTLVEIAMMFRSLVLIICGILFDRVAAHVLPTKADLLVKGLDEIVPQFGLFEGSMYAGRLPIKNGDRSGELMFWLFAPDRPVSKNSIQLWVSLHSKTDSPLHSVTHSLDGSYRLDSFDLPLFAHCFYAAKWRAWLQQL